MVDVRTARALSDAFQLVERVENIRMLLAHLTDEALARAYLTLAHVFLRLRAGSLQDDGDFLQREQIAHRVQMNALVEMLARVELREEFLADWLGDTRTGRQIGGTVLELHA